MNEADALAQLILAQRIQALNNLREDLADELDSLEHPKPQRASSLRPATERIPGLLRALAVLAEHRGSLLDARAQQGGNDG